MGSWWFSIGIFIDLAKVMGGAHVSAFLGGRVAFSMDFPMALRVATGGHIFRASLRASFVLAVENHEPSGLKSMATSTPTSAGPSKERCVGIHVPRGPIVPSSFIDPSLLRCTKSRNLPLRSSLLCICALFGWGWGEGCETYTATYSVTVDIAKNYCNSENRKMHARIAIVNCNRIL
jgi:hypothetical protein